jgi:hypothetical protein
VNEGFVFVGAGACSECGGKVMWYRTPERKKRMPIDASKKIPHWWCCPALAKGNTGRRMQLELFSQV